VGIDVLVGIRGEACHLVDAARQAGLAVDAAFFFPIRRAAGRPLCGDRATGRRDFVQGFARHPRRARPGEVPRAAELNALLAVLRKAVSSLHAVSRVRIRHVSAPRSQLDGLFLCIALGPWLIAKLREFQIGQYIREDGPKSHMKKAGTPTMGGILIIISIVCPRCCGPIW
jgi:hypothetical protein